MSLEKRLEEMKAYRAAAIELGDPSDKLYIDDLNISIAEFEKQVEMSKLVIQNGWSDNETN